MEHPIKNKKGELNMIQTKLDDINPSQNMGSDNK